jgi:hypothetical protein
LIAFLPLAEIEDLFARYIFNPIDRKIRESVDEHSNLVSEAKQAMNLGDIYNVYKEAARSNAQAGHLELVKLMADELIIMALYKSIERERALVLAEVDKHIDLGKLSDWRYTVTNFSFLQRLVGAAQIDELRLINNCIKHSGRVSRALSMCHPAWVLGEPLSNLRSAYQRIAPYVSAYWIDLIQTVKDEATARSSHTSRVA